jgi:uncharacterized membrane protein
VLRVIRHLLTPFWILRLRYQRPLLAQIEQRIGEVERRHPGELRFAVEHALELGDLLAGVTPRERALEVFGLLRVWDTEHNNGVLIYILHAEHAVEIVADRGLARCVPQSDWDALCRRVEADFRGGRFGEGALAVIDGTAQLLEKHSAGLQGGRDELPNQPLLL